MLVFPESSTDLDSAFNSALGQGVFSFEEKSTDFWARFELLASISENDAIVSDVFITTSGAFKTIPRKEISK